MSMPETTWDLETAESEVTVEQFLETLYGIRPGESRPRAVPRPYPFGPELQAWLRLWGLDGGEDR
ncbi:MAG: hypothetical protein ACRDZ7_09205 [Acidimicrobiia bacterium]